MRTRRCWSLSSLRRRRWSPSSPCTSPRRKRGAAGLTTSWRRRSRTSCSSSAHLLILIEGWICAILIVPLFALIGGLAGLAMGAICRATDWPRRTIVGCVALLPLITGAFEQHLPLPNRERVAEREIVVAPPRPRCGASSSTSTQIQPAEVDDAWMYRIGVPLPIAGVGGHARRRTSAPRHDGQGHSLRPGRDANGAKTRASPGATASRPTRFQPARSTITCASAASISTSAKPRIHFDARDGQTRLQLRMRYRVSTRFNWYAGPRRRICWSAISPRSMLRFYARRAEDAARSSAGRTPRSGSRRSRSTRSPPGSATFTSSSSALRISARASGASMLM